MTAEIYDPAQITEANAIAMTPAARDHVHRQLAGNGATALLLGVRESGCNGYMYDLSYVEGDVQDARRFDFDGVTILVEKTNWPLVQGTRIDYVTEGLNSILTFKNPNAASECGCGESFSVREGAVQTAP